MSAFPGARLPPPRMKRRHGNCFWLSAKMTFISEEVLRRSGKHGNAASISRTIWRFLPASITVSCVSVSVPENSIQEQQSASACRMVPRTPLCRRPEKASAFLSIFPLQGEEKKRTGLEFSRRNAQKMQRSRGKKQTRMETSSIHTQTKKEERCSEQPVNPGMISP